MCEKKVNMSRQSKVNMDNVLVDLINICASYKMDLSSTSEWSEQEKYDNIKLALQEYCQSKNIRLANPLIKQLCLNAAMYLGGKDCKANLAVKEYCTRVPWDKEKLNWP